MFWRLALATCSQLNPVAKIACFAQIGQFLKPFEFPLNFCDYSLSSLFEPLSNSPCLSRKTSIFFNISTSISKKKVWIFLLSLSISYSLPWISWFVSFYWGLCYMGFRTWVGLFLLSVTEWVLLIILLRCYILVLSWLNFSIEYVYWSVLIWACHTHCDLS